MAALRGKIVLLDFWTYCCINCLHVLPELERLERRFPSELVVVGVHSAKFDDEGLTENVRAAVRRYAIRHPVVNDPGMILWGLYGVRAWPTLVLVDPEGYIVWAGSGEGHVATLEALIGELRQRFRDRIRSEAPAGQAPGGSPGEGPLAFPGKLWAHPGRDRLYVADSGHHRILEVERSTMRVLRIFGSGRPGLEDGPATRARFRDPQGLAVHDETLFVADRGNHALRAVDLHTGEVRTVLGDGERLAWDQAPGSPPGRLSSPWDLAWHGGWLYLAMAGRHQIWRYRPPDGHLEVWAGSGREDLVDGARLRAALAQPSGLAVLEGWLYWVDAESSAVRRAPLAGEGGVETLVGTGLFDFGDADGHGPKARLQHPLGIAAWGKLLVVADTYNDKLKILDPASRRLATWAGDGTGGWRDGPAGEARFDEPGGVAVADGVVFVADTNNHRIRLLDPEGARVRTVALQMPSGD
jgi:thiol-disulfide isomerase/thioredoxin